MTREIRELDAQTVERIAAGEVVERPASAVKELLENSLDADATRVTVAVESGGIDGIRVTDNGIGMDERTLKKAVKKHTTSKLRDINDLESGIGTLGFRGEALHAIGAVSRLTITSRPRGGDRGTELTVAGGEITSVAPVGSPEGTTVEVSDLFYNVPARRKYLKTDATEFDHVSSVVTNYALANPDVAITLEHNGRETFATTGTGNRQETVLSVYGRKVAEAMIPVEYQSENDGPLDGVSGLVSHPETNRASRAYLSTFINGRYVTASAVREAIMEAYGGQLAPDRYPFAVLFLSVDPATVDVNVHPRKLEVRFADEGGVREQIQTAVKDALLDAGLIRTSAPRGKSAVEQTEIEPEQPDDAELRHESEPSGQATHTETDAETPPATETDTTAATDAETADPTMTDGETASVTDAETTPTTDTDANLGNVQAPQHGGVSAEETADSLGSEASGNARSQGESSDYSTGELSQQSATPTAPDSNRETEPTVRPSRTRPTHRDDTKFAGAQTQRTLTEETVETEQSEFEQLPKMRILGQFKETYIIAETPDGLVLIDQHAADERINYERLQESVAGGTTTQALADPVRIELTAREVELFDQHSAALARLGFHASRVDDNIVEVTTLPTLVAETAGPELVRDVLGEFVRGDIAAAETVEATVNELLADLACYPSVTGNTSLSEGSVLELLETLDDCENPWACPHGRPVVIELGTDEIEARFERDYPGHG